MIPREWSDLAAFQLDIAQRWRVRALKTGDHFAAFFFSYAAFNALYFLWSKLENLRGREEGCPPNEVNQIQNLLSKTGATAGSILAVANQSVVYFMQRSPVQRMDKRSANQAIVGDPREGRKARDKLATGDDLSRLVALGTILYLVRSNLAHGSKADAGDDEQVISNALPGLRAIVDWTLDYTRGELTNA